MKGVMFNPAPRIREVASKDSLAMDDSAVEPVRIKTSRLSQTTAEAHLETTWPPPGAKVRIKANKGAVVRVARRCSNPQASSLEEVWAPREEPEEKPQSPETRKPPEAMKNGVEGHGGAPPRSRKNRFRAPDVRTIFSPSEKDPRVKEETGEGHTFEPGGENNWCDVCCNYILQHGLTCAGCKYACHAECRESVSLDCHPAASPLSQDQLNNNTPLHDVEKERWGRTELSREEIQQRIHHYNSMTKDYLKMTLNPTGVYTGFIKVVLDLRRPVTVRGGQRGAGGEAVMQEAFYLPQEVSNTLHISSENTVKQVIMALLNKFTVADNPAKYALYKRYRREEQVYVCKLADGEKPLFLRLVAGPNLDVLSFVLREQQTGEVMWDAFSIPELQNFLRILDKEEQEQRDAVIRRYEAYRQRLQEAIMEVRGPS
ncbi:PREDICTED: ras association domain-containing protein 3 isoform X1 [Cyprinodon variegatus]|uniref:Ras association domain family member 3 n=1 Tax=Cyprinodon variegatus TaxID=28743 RepID=A0A3Q2E7R5_CYPVA|nr:PREDICTED: ras association domain-containing protein 3 isoform X1 [Cyprinodon variegatus]